MNQRTLFDGTDLLAHPPASRRTDPATSRAAEREITESGRRDSQADQCLAVLRANPEGLTAGEVAFKCGLMSHVVMKRLPDLRAKGLATDGPARECGLHKTLQQTWYPTQRGAP